MVFFSGCVSVFLFDFYTTQKNLLISTGYDRYPVTAIDRDRDRGYGDRFGGAGPYGAPQEPVSCFFFYSSDVTMSFSFRRYFHVETFENRQKSNASI